MNRFTIDVHQHLWPEPLVAALARRAQPPRLRGWTLELASEAAYEVNPAQHDPVARAEQAAADEIDLAVVSLSSPLGIELLESDQAQELLEAYHDGTLALGPPFAGWAAACLTDVDAAALQRELERGFVGLQLPATTLLDEPGYERVGPLLEVLERSQRPLFVHPGPAEGVSRELPGWWAAIVSYVQQMHAAWYAFRAWGRARHPRLRVSFALLAGLAPLHGERFAARAGARSVIDENSYLEVSTYGTRASDATLRAVRNVVVKVWGPGVDEVVYRDSTVLSFLARQLGARVRAVQSRVEESTKSAPTDGR